MATGDEKREKPSGSIDGANTTFTTSIPYVAGTLFPYINGQTKKKSNDDGWIETSPGTGEFQLKDAPRLNDIIHVRYIEA